jgi:hypothetical protein
MRRPRFGRRPKFWCGAAYNRLRALNGRRDRMLHGTKYCDVVLEASDIERMEREIKTLEQLTGKASWS